MNGELLHILDQLEREKGIKREVLIAAVEAALMSAAKKAAGDKTSEVTVKLDPKTGAIKIFSGDKEITSGDFGRIAAQTAKQVIIQKIREAERDVIYEEYGKKLGNITSGAIHRFERGNIVVDLVKTEGIIPKKQQSPKETFRQGDRVRALIYGVEKTPKGPQIILSRSDPEFVRKLFELEVPEIYEGIVEIKTISREAGDRTKMAVLSKDEKVEPVGACVGMRGTRVKNIVKELHGEKIDIIRWHEDIRQFVTESLSPAKVSEVKVDKENRKVLVIVEDDQLSLAIGKKGQNVRLASKLTGFDIDIKSRSALVPKIEISIAEIPGIGPKTQKLLREAGFEAVSSIAQAKLEDLTKVKGLGKKTAEKVQKSAKEVLKEPAKKADLPAGQAGKKIKKEAVKEEAKVETAKKTGKKKKTAKKTTKKSTSKKTSKKKKTTSQAKGGEEE